MGESKRKKAKGIIHNGLRSWTTVKDFDFEKSIVKLKSYSNGKSPTTPSRPAGIQVTRFCKTISVEEPVFLPFTHVSDEYGAAWCHFNVAEQIKRVGGSRQHGWMIWYHSTHLCAEFHSVWVNEAGEYIDLTPRVHGEVEILFLPDMVNGIGFDGTYETLPLTRTSIKEVPYTYNGRPHDEPEAPVELDPDTPFGHGTMRILD